MNVFDSEVPELAKPETKVPTKADVKAFQKNFVTRNLPTVIKCGHKLDPEVGPNTNCVYCWLTFFNNSSDRIYALADELVKEGGQAKITAMYGKKFLKWYRKFLIAVNEIKESNGEK